MQSSIQRQLGLVSDMRRIPSAEQGIAETMVDLYRSIADPISGDMFFRRRRMLNLGRGDLAGAGRFRASPASMQVDSGPIGAERVHFEAPPSRHVPGEMERFVAWFNATGPLEGYALPALTRAGIAHLYFESIHPFEDGNGRIGRALAEKALLRTMSEGPSGFKGGMSAGKYAVITGSSPATATRELAGLVEQGALIRTGERKHTRYVLNLPPTQQDHDEGTAG